jgi:hypothetical protein
MLQQYWQPQKTTDAELSGLSQSWLPPLGARHQSNSLGGLGYWTWTDLAEGYWQVLTSANFRTHQAIKYSTVPFPLLPLEEHKIKEGPLCNCWNLPVITMVVAPRIKNKNHSLLCGPVNSVPSLIPNTYVSGWLIENAPAERFIQSSGSLSLQLSAPLKIGGLKLFIEIETNFFHVFLQ